MCQGVGPRNSTGCAGDGRCLVRLEGREHTHMYAHTLGHVRADFTEPDVHVTGPRGTDIKLERFWEPDLWGLERIPSRGLDFVFWALGND